VVETSLDIPTGGADRVGDVWVKLRWLTPIRHKRGALGGFVVANSFGETSVGTLQARGSH
jgi:hypothetical protein